MAGPLSEDLRKRIVAKRSEGYSSADISQMFGVSIRSVDRFCERLRKDGTLSHSKLGSPPGSSLEPHREKITSWIKQEPGLTLEELASRLASELNVHVHVTTVMRALSRWDFRYKKKLSTRGSKIELTSKKNVLCGGSCNRTGTQASWSSSTSVG